MPKRGKRKGDGDFSDDNSDDHAPAKKRVTDDSVGIPVCEISKNRRVVVKMWQGKVYVDIREFYTNADGKQMPGKKGISLSLDQWEILRAHIDKVDKAIV
eukprot:Gb_21693 [translate_table: standard]